MGRGQLIESDAATCGLAARSELLLFVAKSHSKVPAFNVEIHC